MSAPPLARRLADIPVDALAPVWRDLDLDPDRVARGPRAAGPPEAETSALLAIPPGTLPLPERAEELRELAERAVGARGTLVLYLAGRRPDRELAGWRNQLWPSFHVGALYHLLPRGACVRRTLAGVEEVAPPERKPVHVRVGVALVARRREWAMSPESTVTKFDANAAGWNGRPGTPGYGHFRWMRRFVADLADAPRGARVLDFGCGAGWVGIEAARRLAARELCAFDPSPEMIRIAEANAAASGIPHFAGRTGFGEEPPFPAPGEEPFEVVLSSGVLSFAPDRERWLDGLDRAVAPGGTLVIGDLCRDSLGMRRRRRRKPLLPARELSAATREQVREALEARGYVHRRSRAYQLTTPVPELMAWDEAHSGWLAAPLLALNRLAAGLDGLFGSPLQVLFDSWAMRLSKPRAWEAGIPPGGAGPLNDPNRRARSRSGGRGSSAAPRA